MEGMRRDKIPMRMLSLTQDQQGKHTGEETYELRLVLVVVI